jgi:WD40-like Beta Propeller Repeat
MAADGSGQVNDASLDGLAARSTDGTRIALMSERSGDREIYTMAADGSDVVRLTHDPGADRNPTWAHDDTEILFTSNRDGDLDVYAMAPEGSDVRNLTQHPHSTSCPTGHPPRTSDHSSKRAECPAGIGSLNAPDAPNARSATSASDIRAR